MALILDTAYRGIAVQGAYAKVAYLAVADDKQSQSFAILYHVAQGAEVFSSVSYTGPYNLDGKNPFVQAYEYLRTLPEFSEAIDC